MAKDAVQDGPVIIRLTPEELASKTLTSRHLQRALEALNQDGLVVLENAVDPAHLDQLNGRMVADAAILRSRQDVHVNFGAATNNIQQEPPTAAGYVFDDVIANPWAAHVLEHALGPRPKVRLYSANTALQATARQPVHIDVDTFPHAAHGYCVNINLVSTSPENGATEFWLGTHNDPALGQLGDDGDDNNDSDYKRLVEARRRVRPPIQAGLPKGSLVIRDVRIWHAGMPNRTESPRVMLVTAVFASWFRCKQTFKLPKRCQGTIDWGRLEPCIDWQEDDYAYLQGAHDIDLTQAD